MSGGELSAEDQYRGQVDLTCIPVLLSLAGFMLAATFGLCRDPDFEQVRYRLEASRKTTNIMRLG